MRKLAGFATLFELLYWGPVPCRLVSGAILAL